VTRLSISRIENVCISQARCVFFLAVLMGVSVAALLLFLFFFSIHDDCFSKVHAAGVRTRAAGQGTKQDRPVCFFHFHKAAGNSICNYAKNNGQLLTDKQRVLTCNLPGDGPSTTKQDAIGKTCEYREEELAMTKSDFFAVERWLDTMCSPYMYITILRHPLQRLLSHAVFENQKEHIATSGVREALKKYPKAKVPRAWPRSHWCTWGVSTINDFYVRSLLGKQAYLAPVQSLTDADRVNAQEKLAKFDVVGIVEHWEETKQLLGAVLKWTDFHIQKTNPSRHGSFNEYFKAEEDREILISHNQLDVKLYHNATQLFYGQLRAQEIEVPTSSYEFNPGATQKRPMLGRGFREHLAGARPYNARP
jgi:hypothetical protein